MRKTVSLILASALVASVATQPALADWHDHGDIHHFGDHDYDHWRGGSWFNGEHGGRHGWWWIVDGAWYYYPSPVYPFPDPYTPSVVGVTPAPVATIGAPSYAYYCRNPAGYYPYVPQCFGHWHRVATGTTTIIQQQQPTAVVVQQQPSTTVAPPPQPAPYEGPTKKSGGERAADEHRLNDYAADFQNIDPTGQQAAGRLDELGKKVEEFRQGLYKRNYNAIEVSKNAEDLQRRIHEAREHLGAPPPGISPPPQ